jgi:hypothetical protein
MRNSRARPRITRDSGVMIQAQAGVRATNPAPPPDDGRGSKERGSTGELQRARAGGRDPAPPDRCDGIPNIIKVVKTAMSAGRRMFPSLLIVGFRSTLTNSAVHLKHDYSAPLFTAGTQDKIYNILVS